MLRPVPMPHYKRDLNRLNQMTREMWGAARGSYARCMHEAHPAQPLQMRWLPHSEH